MLGIKTLCPFCDYISECSKPDCTGCPIREENTIKMDEQIAENMQDFWACRRSGAE